MSTDMQKSVAFQEKLVQSMAGHMETMLACIGYERGFFKSCQWLWNLQLVQRNKVDERYLREWLNGMVAASYLSFDQSSSMYSIPPEHIPVLAQEYGPMFMGGMLNLIGSTTAMLPKVKQCFVNGGGVDYSEYGPDFWRGMERYTGTNFDNNLMSWIKMVDPMVEEKLRKGVRVCDFGYGEGRALLILSKKYPNSTFIGYDILAHEVQEGYRKAKEEGLTNLSFAQIGEKADKIPSSSSALFGILHD